jgi:hypothetical protein
MYAKLLNVKHTPCVRIMSDASFRFFNILLIFLISVIIGNFGPVSCSDLWDWPVLYRCVGFQIVYLNVGRAVA